ncbi:hypothetical protein BP6252_07412 [Coleophoma cylindrospora]|uniref:Dihydroorotate dehydrogenase (fumarate) n=1 Tax=Coleophoma cylindrospora TaxID=1849047 RepID=A0A3D8RHH4_9HELO|nr:hypothetical protein BP6252_07412 [Coleophoma cylindrospora]
MSSTRGPTEAGSPEPFAIHPPLLNSSNPWATTLADLTALYACPLTGAVTTRTSLLQGFPHNAAQHQYTFFSGPGGAATAQVGEDGRSEVKSGEGCSLNTLGYSPIVLDEYLAMVVEIAAQTTPRTSPKPFIVSVTGSAEEVAECYRRIAQVAAQNAQLTLFMEVNLSCPNILDKPPPAYDGAALAEYLRAIAAVKAGVHVGIKTPPYTYQGQYVTLMKTLEDATETCPISFITATNTLGSCLVLNEQNDPALGSASGSGIGGVAGEAIHPLALGNVKTIRSMLDASPRADIKGISIIGIGGVSDGAGFRRMKSVGAAAVGVGTALGREGVAVFTKITSALNERDLTF